MAETKALIAAGAAAALFAAGAVVASSLGSAHDGASRSTSSDESGVSRTTDPYHDAYVQAAMASYDARLLRYAQGDESFTGARFAFGSRSLILYGSAAPAPTVRRLLRDPPADVDVRWVRVPYSRADLDDAIAALRRAMPPATVVEYAPNFAGVLVGLRPLPTSPGRVALLYARAQDATEVPVTFLQAGFADPM
jgi:hypothetical protein